MKRPDFAIVAGTAFALVLGVGSVQAAALSSDASSSVSGALGGAPLANSVLASHRGGHATELNIAKLRAKLDQNKALNDVTGNNYVGQGVFTNANGFGTVVQNSGNNVIIQNSTIVNLKMQ